MLFQKTTRHLQTAVLKILTLNGQFVEHRLHVCLILISMVMVVVVMTIGTPAVGVVVAFLLGFIDFSLTDESFEKVFLLL